MGCKRCGSEVQEVFDGELTASAPDIERLEMRPFYLCQDILICLMCGHAELAVPASELSQLRKGLSESNSRQQLFR
jgi:hypothetical protein